MPPKVSVIMPVYNSERFLRAAMESVLKQTFQDFEVILVDDGSTDGSGQIAGEFVQRHPDKIRLLRQSNAGPAAARNTGIKASQGELIALLDADDVWEPKRLEEGVKFLSDHPDIGLVHSQTRRIDENGRIIRHSSGLNPGNQSGWIFEKLLLRQAHVPCLSVLFRRVCWESCGGFDEDPNLRGVEDRDLWLRMAQQYPFGFIDKVLVCYRIHSQGISRDVETMALRRRYMLEKYVNEKDHPQLYHKALGALAREMSDYYIQRGEWGKAKEYLKVCLAGNPWNPILIKNYCVVKFWQWKNAERVH